MENMLYFHLPSGASEAAALGTDCADPREEVTADINTEETLSSARSVRSSRLAMRNRRDADAGPCSF